MIEIDIERTRERIALDRRLLAEQLAPHGAGPDLVDELLTACEEWGAAEVSRRLAEAPHQWQLTELSPARRAVVGKLLGQLDDQSQAFDRLIASREDILAEADPGRRRVYAWFGRELVLEDGGRGLRFADQATPEPGAAVAVPNRVAPTTMSDAGLTPGPTRRRDRDI